MTISPIERRPGTAGDAGRMSGLVPTRRASDDPPRPERPVVEPPIAPPGVRLCRCGHEEEAHEHYRDGDDCGICGAVRCRSFRLRTGRQARFSARR